MIDAPPGSSYAPPPDRDARLIRGAALVLFAIITWADAVTPMGVAVPAMFVAPILLFATAGRPWEPLAAAALASSLIAAGMLVTPDGGSIVIGTVNRALAIALVWISGGAIAQYRLTRRHWLEQYRADQAARQLSIQRLEEFRYALDQAAIVATTDQTGTITFVNDKFCQISGYSREELLGQDHRIINSGYHSKDFIRGLWQTIARGEVWRGELRNRAKDGTLYWVDTTIVPFLDARGKPRQYLAIRSDITQRKAAETLLVEQSALAQLGQLAAVMAHEVRNPLAGVKGTLQVLRSRAAEGSGDRGVMDTMIARLDVLNSKVDDILRFARPRSPALETVDLKPVVLDAIASARAAAAHDCPDIQPPAASVTLLADREMLRDILLNLLLNACQSGTKAPVEVRVTEDGAACAIEVADRGTGLRGEDPERLFEAFHTTKKSGTGLGLAIVRRLASLHGGRVSLSPREGGGAIARVELPLHPAHL